MNAPGGILAFDNSIRASERHRISRELHHSTSQLLVALQLQLGLLRKFVAVGSSQPLLDEMAATIQSIHESIRQIEFERLDEEAFEDRQVQTAKAFLSLATDRHP